jgi:serine/threonine protein kinase
MPTRVGTNLDRYEIDAELGRGAMGVVYRARDLKLNRTVAIKTVSIAGLEPAEEQEYRRRFVVEAQAAGRLSHPGIITIFDVRDDAEPYLVMEYVEGQSLQQLVSREHRTLPLSTTLRLIQELAEALHYAHARGVVHRDIKPANILVTADGHPKIADFGIAKLNQSELTLPGQVLGSPAYMAPEQLSEAGVDARSDLFSLGVILYYMLTGHRPFQGNSATTVCFKLVNHEPLPVSAFESKLPLELDRIVSRAMAKDPAQRYQTGLAMASDLQRLRESSGFVHGSVEWTAHSLKHDAIPRYVRGCAEPRSTGRDSGDQEPEPSLGLTTESGGSLEDSPAARARRSHFSWKPVLVSALFAIATTFVTFRSFHRTQPELSGPTRTEPTAQPSTSAVDDGHSNRALPAAKQSEPPKKVSRSQAKMPGPATKIPAAAASAPVHAILQIEIEHHFTNALASVWLDEVLVYTHSLQGKKTRRALLFRKVAGHHFDAISVPVGKHEVRVRVQSAKDSYDESKTIAEVLLRSKGTLRIVCGKKPDKLQLTLQ